jgi:hypothetical protein
MNDAKLEMMGADGEWFEVGTARDVVLVVDGTAWPWGIVDEAEQVAPLELDVLYSSGLMTGASLSRGSRSVSLELEPEDAERVRGAIVVGGGRRGGMGLFIGRTTFGNSLDFDMPKLVESAPGSFTGKGRKAHKKFNRKMGGGW